MDEAASSASSAGPEQFVKIANASGNQLLVRVHHW
jgi:hypothetical protein